MSAPGYTTPQNHIPRTPLPPDFRDSENFRYLPYIGYMGLGKILNSPVLIASGTWKNSELFLILDMGLGKILGFFSYRLENSDLSSLYRLWDLEAFHPM